MKISVITINYNNVEGLKQTLDSVAIQTYRDIEHIIIDGGSADGSVEAIKEYMPIPAGIHSLNILSIGYQRGIMAYIML